MYYLKFVHAYHDNTCIVNYRKGVLSYESYGKCNFSHTKTAISVIRKLQFQSHKKCSFSHTKMQFQSYEKMQFQSYEKLQLQSYENCIENALLVIRKPYFLIIRQVIILQHLSLTSKFEVNTITLSNVIKVLSWIFL